MFGTAFFYGGTRGFSASRGSRGIRSTHICFNHSLTHIFTRVFNNKVFGEEGKGIRWHGYTDGDWDAGLFIFFSSWGCLWDMDMFTRCMGFMGCTSDVRSSEALCVGCLMLLGEGAGGLHGMGGKIGRSRWGGNEETGR